MDLSERLPAALAFSYQIERELGRGGMATVYLARDLKHDRLVAVKVLRPDLAAVLGGERFLREIQLTAQLQHPHILPLLDSGQAAGFLYYVMPYIEGETLRHKLTREGQLPIEETLQLTKSVAGALDYAHQRGVIHRDIKPENILLYQGEPMVADFGVALAAASAGRERLTETGLSLGTPAYMSPEQASASPKLDARSDQYSLACVVYEMLAGEPPYTGPTAQAVIAKRFSEPIPHLSTVREVPVGLERAITRALARSPADRFPSVSIFGQALGADPTMPTTIAGGRPGSVRLKWLLRSAAVIPLLAILALLGRHLRSTSGPGIPTHRQFTFTAQAEEPAFSPDGKTIAYVSQHRSLVLEDLAGGGPVTVVPPVPQLGSPRWSPDGRWLYFRMIPDTIQPSGIYRIPSSGGAPVKLAVPEMSDAWGPFDLSPSGDAMVRVSRDSLLVLDLKSGKERVRLAVGGPGLREGKERLTSLGAVRNVSWSPDGRWIASTEEGLGGSSILVTSADGQRGTRLADGIGPVKWSPKSDALYFLAMVSGGTDLMRLRFDSHTGSASDQPRVVLSGLPTLLDWTAVFDLRHDGHMLAYVRGPQSHHVWALTIEQHRDTAIGRRLSEDSRAYDWPALKRDGSSLAVVQYDGSGRGIGDFFTVPFGGGEFTRLTQGPGYKSNASWSPDGTSLVYVLTDSTGSKLILTDRRGGRRRIGTTPPFLVGYYRTSWSADGRTLLYPAVHARTLVALDVAQGRETLISTPDSLDFWMAAVVSPDGRRVVAAENHRATDQFRLWRTSVAESQWISLPTPAGDNIPLLWREDGWIYLFNQVPGSLPVIWRMKPDSVRQEVVAHLPVACRFGFVSISGDARRLVCAVHGLEPDLWLVSNFDTD
jgi:serine/threonine protein kinase/Tol biopolymer transport system component